jgi:hypothetical protein
MISAANYSVADFPQTALGAVRPSYGTSNGSERAAFLLSDHSWPGVAAG